MPRRRTPLQLRGQARSLFGNHNVRTRDNNKVRRAQHILLEANDTSLQVFNQIFRGLRQVGKVLEQMSGYDVTSYLEILQLFDNRSDES